MAKRDSINTLGASNHSKKERSILDYYGTDPRATRALLGVEKFNNNVWEPTSGHKLIVRELKAENYTVKASDIFDYGNGAEIIDFLDYKGTFEGDIVMNPPYYDAEEFVSKAISVVKDGAKVAAFLRLLFLEGQGRYERLFSKHPPKKIYVFSKRQVCSKVDDFTEGSAVAYCWIIWEKGFSGNPEVRWI